MVNFISTIVITLRCIRYLILYSKCATRVHSEVLLDLKREHACLVWTLAPPHVPLPPGSAVFHVWSMTGAGSRDMLVWTLAPPHVPVPPAPNIISSSIPRCEWHISSPRWFPLFGWYNCCIIHTILMNPLLIWYWAVISRYINRWKIRPRWKASVARDCPNHSDLHDLMTKNLRSN